MSICECGGEIGEGETLLFILKHLGLEMFSLLLPTILQMVVMLIRKQLVSCTVVALLRHAGSFPSNSPRFSAGWPPATTSIGFTSGVIRIEQLLRADRDATRVFRHLIVMRIVDARLVELRHHVHQLLRAALEHTHGQLVVWPRVLNLLDLGRVRSITLKNCVNL